MFQCALFGITNEKFEWNCEKFTRIEKVYRNRQKVAVISVNTNYKDKNSVIFYDLPDKNKQRTSVVSKIVKSEMNENYDSFMISLGYSLQRTNQISGFRYLRNGYMIEISKFVKKDIVDSSEEESHEEENVPTALYKNYLVKVFVETSDVVYGEMILQKACLDLIDVIKLIKPNLSIF